uniref:EF-hand domain-containing protein n=1 Tax=Kalanchoe fedtschenkoi TaxID=63787 RepID=A0A7N0SXS0_KALFE
MEVETGLVFEDNFPSMVAQMGVDAFMEELCAGFTMLMDVNIGLITFESLKKNIAVLGLHDVLGDDEILCMLSEGDLDGDGALNQMEFCVLMLDLSPGLMKGRT